MELSESLISGVGVHIDEALATGGEVTVIGLAIVFAVLVILMIVLMRTCGRRAGASVSSTS